MVGNAAKDSHLLREGLEVEVGDTFAQTPARFSLVTGGEVGDLLGFVFG